MRTEYIEPGYTLDPNEFYWLYGEEDLELLIELMDKGEVEKAKRILREKRIPLGWLSNK